MEHLFVVISNLFKRKNRMKKAVLVVLSVFAVTFGFAGSVNATGPTKDVVQPAQGLAVAQDACLKYAGDDTKEVACVLFYAGAVKKVDGQYVVNVQLLQPVQGKPVAKCKAELVYLPDGSIGWKDGRDCH